MGDPPDRPDRNEKPKLLPTSSLIKRRSKRKRLPLFAKEGIRGELILRGCAEGGAFEDGGVTKRNSPSLVKRGLGGV